MSTISALVTAGLIVLVLGLYWLPSIVARIKRHPDLVPIVVVNALLGWTVVGWAWAVVRLVSGRPGHRLNPQPAYSLTSAGSSHESAADSGQRRA